MQQYDINPASAPLQVASVQHVPANTPPSPPNSIEEAKNPYATAVSTEAPVLSMYGEADSSADEGAAMSPLQKIALEMDQIEDEMRDRVMPLSPSSSRASSVSSKSSGGGGRRAPSYLYDKASSRGSKRSEYEGTEFSFGASVKPGHESMSIRSTSSLASSKFRSSNLRKEILRSPEEAQATSTMDLFPYVKARLRDVAFRTPFYGQSARTPELLQREMLSVIFGWNDDIESLIRDELSRHRPGSASGVLLAKWLGDLGADSMASMIGSESMTSSDWMLLALSSMGGDSQKKVGEAFVHRLLEKGDIHPAVAILLGLGEQNDAIEVYVSQRFYMEAVLLTCLMCPSDWQRQSYLVRKWGEVAVAQGQPELAVRCFSCTSIETSEPWFSPRAQDAVYAAQQEHFMGGSMASPPLSPPSATGSNRRTFKNASLKLITTFGDKGIPVLSSTDEPTPMNNIGVTPIAESAISPHPGGSFLRPSSRNARDPSSARTATPGAYTRRKRLPSKSEMERARQPPDATPLTAARDFKPSHSRRTSSMSSREPVTALETQHLQPDTKSRLAEHLPSPAQGVFTRLRQQSRDRNGSRERGPGGLHVEVMETVYTDNAQSPAPSTGVTDSVLSYASGQRPGALSPPLTGVSMKSSKTRAIDQYINSVEEAKIAARSQRAESRQRGESRNGRARSRLRDPPENRGRNEVRYIKPAKRSPSSPVPMSPEEVYNATSKNASEATDATDTDGESFYKIMPPEEPTGSKGRRHDPPPAALQNRSDSRLEQRQRSPDRLGVRAASRTASRQRSPDAQRLRVDARGRSQSRKAGSIARSPSSPLPMSPEHQLNKEDDETQSDGQRVRIRQRSSSRRAHGETESQRRASPSRSRARSSSRKPTLQTHNELAMAVGNYSTDSIAEEQASESSMSQAADDTRRPRLMSRKQIAARELEERRLSLARRPSAPAIPLPGQHATRPPMSSRAHTDLSNSPHSYMPPMSRSQTVDPEAMSRYNRTTGTSTTSAPIGLPATPRAMRHPRYMSADPDGDSIPAVPDIPENLAQLAPSVYKAKEEADADQLAPLLPSTVFGQRGPQGPARSVSAPPEKNFGGLPSHPAYKAALPPSSRRFSLTKGHARKISPSEVQQAQHNPAPVTASIDEALHDTQVIIIEEQEAPPMLLPELQHLAGPPPPPPPPTMYQQGHNPRGSLGVINIAIGGNEPPTVVDVTPSATPSQPESRATTASPSMHRRGRGSVSEGFGTRLRNVTDRMRSTSRSRAKSPPMEGYQAAPYETVLPPMPYTRRESISRAKSPYEASISSSQSNDAIPIPPPPPPPPQGGAGGLLNEQTIPPNQTLPPSRSGSAMGGYRNPKEIRANMPPDQLQQGVYQPMQGGMI